MPMHGCHVCKRIFYHQPYCEETMNFRSMPIGNFYYCSMNCYEKMQPKCTLGDDDKMILKLANGSTVEIKGEI